MSTHSSSRPLFSTLALAGVAALGSTLLVAPAQADAAVSIAQVQGVGGASPHDSDTVTVRGVVTAVYAEGGLKGYYIQTPGTGAAKRSEGASDAIFVYSPATVGSVQKNQLVQVTGTVTDYHGQTQISVPKGGAKVLAEPFEPVTPITDPLPEDEAAREALEGMLLQPSGPITITDNYTTNRYGEVGLVNGTEPLHTATDVVAPGKDAIAYEEASKAKAFVLDDGATVDYTRSATGTPVAYLGRETPLRVGAQVTFQNPVVLGYSYNMWRLQPTEWVNGSTPASNLPATWTDTREQAPAVAGDYTIASFNVLNYFPTVGESLQGCKYYTDREKNPITVSGGCLARGAATLASFTRQQAKIVTAINQLDASVLSLEEIENSAAFGKDRDDALNKLVAALNAHAGYEKWAAVASPAELPTSEDVIRTAFIYQPAQVTTVGESEILLGGDAFNNARRPLAQTFVPVTAKDQADADRMFVAVVNHFKSTGSGSGENADKGDGQGASVASRVAQAEALRDFARELAAEVGTEHTILLGDFNSYTQEDPMQVLYREGYTNVGEHFNAGNTYLFGGRVGSLDHVLVSPSLAEQVQDAKVWNINSVESVGLEYSRYNANITNLYTEDAFRSSDHDPALVGFNLPAAPELAPVPEPAPVVPVFTDVPTDHMFHTEISWLAQRGITTGWPDGTFRPAENVQRAAVAAYFYRLAGSPTYTPPITPSFKDVPIDHPFYKEIEWLRSTGITTGWEDGTFRPTEPVSRAAMAAFFYRFHGEPVVDMSQAPTFSDVSEQTMFHKEITWLAQRGITTGWSDGTFRPGESISRAATAAFIYRYEHQRLNVGNE